MEMIGVPRARPGRRAAIADGAGGSLSVQGAANREQGRANGWPSFVRPNHSEVSLSPATATCDSRPSGEVRDDGTH